MKVSVVIPDGKYATDQTLHVLFDYDVMETFGSKSLTGCIADAVFRVGCKWPKKIVLKFAKPSAEWLKQHGEHLMVIPSYVIPCLLEDVVHIKGVGKKDGVTIIAEQVEKDPGAPWPKTLFSPEDILIE